LAYMLPSCAFPPSKSTTSWQSIKLDYPPPGPTAMTHAYQRLKKPESFSFCSNVHATLGDNPQHRVVICEASRSATFFEDVTKSKPKTLGLALPTMAIATCCDSMCYAFYASNKPKMQPFIDAWLWPHKQCGAFREITFGK